MARFNAYLGSATPVINANNNNLNLMGISTIRAQIQEVSWGGQASSSTVMETRCTRTSSAGTTAPAAADVQRLDQTLTTPGNAILAYANAAWATGPTKVAGALFGESWNAYGGVVRWLAAPGEEWDIALTTNGIVMAAVVGTATSSYNATWVEF